MIASGVESLPLETARFGVATGRVSPAGPSEVPPLVAAARSERFQLLIARVPAAATAVVQALEDAGFRLMDTLVTYERSLGGAMGVAPADPRVRAARPGDEAAVASVAGAAFRGYAGHYYADARLDRRAADAAYVDWAGRCLRERAAADQVLVAEADGTVCAFGAFRLASAEVCDLVLYAVAPGAQREGLGRALTSAGLRWAAARGCGRFRSSTQLTNLASQTLWTRLQMSPVAAQHTLHLWL